MRREDRQAVQCLGGKQERKDPQLHWEGCNQSKA